MLLAALMMLASDKPDAPFRDSGITLTSTGTMTDLRACTIRLVAKSASATEVPQDGGYDIDLTMKRMFLPSEPTMTFQLRGDDGAVKVSALYRHPFSQKLAASLLRDLGKKCVPGYVSEK